MAFLLIQAMQILLGLPTGILATNLCSNWATIPSKHRLCRVIYPTWDLVECSTVSTTASSSNSLCTNKQLHMYGHKGGGIKLANLQTFRGIMVFKRCPAMFQSNRILNTQMWWTLRRVVYLPPHRRLNKQTSRICPSPSVSRLLNSKVRGWRMQISSHSRLLMTYF